VRRGARSAWRSAAELLWLRRRLEELRIGIAELDGLHRDRLAGLGGVLRPRSMTPVSSSRHIVDSASPLTSCISKHVADRPAIVSVKTELAGTSASRPSRMSCNMTRLSAGFSMPLAPPPSKHCHSPCCPTQVTVTSPLIDQKSPSADSMTKAWFGGSCAMVKRESVGAPGPEIS
jgi:hypothetical protein